MSDLTLTESTLPLPLLRRGKVREVYEVDDETLLLVASDRISTFDVILPTEIPDKGRVLTGLSGYWFTLLREIVPNHLPGFRDDGRRSAGRRRAQVASPARPRWGPAWPPPRCPRLAAAARPPARSPSAAAPARAGRSSPPPPPW